jgi:ABC-type Na+ efflux pump permease subunit
MDRANKLILINIIPVLLMLLTIGSLYMTIFNPEELNFGPDNLDKTNAMLQWRSVAITLFTITTFSLGGMIYASIKGKWKSYFWCLFLSVILIATFIIGNPS